MNFELKKRYVEFARIERGELPELPYKQMANAVELLNIIGIHVELENEYQTIVFKASPLSMYFKNQMIEFIEKVLEISSCE